MSMTISDVKIRIDILHSHIWPRRKMTFNGLIISINQHFSWAYWKKKVRANSKIIFSKIDMDSDFELLFCSGSKSSSPLALVLEVEALRASWRKKLFQTCVMKTIAPKLQGTTTTNECVRTAFSKCLGDMDDSNPQTFASGYFSHSQIIKITHILRAYER